MAPQDSFIDEEEETCPLCIEEFDLSDRSFRPCPCGYQVCQFCFNNIKNNMNGLCPACRRPYDERTIEWKVVTPEEIAEFNANIRKNQKNRAQDQQKKEVQKREAEKESRKNLVGVRVVQKNLVYVTGLTPTVREDELLKTLRKPEFFGQYGNIQKISISNRKSSDGQNQSLGIYVTFEKKEDAQRCIQAVNGSPNGDRVLRAQLGTTKYCSAWLRHEQCSNRSCMFLHELGDEEDSYTRQDLSSMNGINSQRPLPPGGSRSASRQQQHQSNTSNAPAPAPPPPPAAAPAPVSQPMARSSSKDESDAGGDSSALPSSANWARNPQRSRRGSHATSGVAPSPVISTSLPVTAEVIDESPATEESSASTPPSSSGARVTKSPPKQLAIPDNLLKAILKALKDCPFNCSGAEASDKYPPMFDPLGGEKRRALREEEDARLAVDQEEQGDATEASEGEPETGGSLALGGEPEDREAGRDATFEQRRTGTQSSADRGNAEAFFGPAIGTTYPQTGSNAGSRSMTPQQPMYVRSQSGFGDHLPPGISPAGQAPQLGHNRQGSRFSFANENAGSASVKVTPNARAMAQQATMMPSAFHSQPGNNSQYYPTSMPGPPPGLKSTGTPPNMFGQGFGGAGFGGATKDSAELLQSLIRGRGGANSQAHDAGKRELMLSFSNQYPPSSSSTPAPAPGLLASLYGSQPGAFQDFGPKQKKKGKKHRHANTSSSGGGGLVDLADPSILQVRMQHQTQQSNAGVGQGLFGGGQSQDDELPSLDEASSSVDALVADDDPLDMAFFQTRSSSAQLTLRQAPAPPPGLGIAPQAAPVQPPVAVPVVPASPARIETPSVPKVQTMAGIVRSATPDQPAKKKVPGSEAKKSIKALAVESGLSKDIASHQQSPSTKSKKLLQEEDFPALDSIKTGVSRVGTPALSTMSTPKSSPMVKKARVEPPKEITPAAAEKKAAPITLNIAAAVKAAAKTPSDTPAASATEKPDSAAFPALPTPAAVVASPSVKAAPKTLRVVNTPKVETPPVLAAGHLVNAATRAVSGISRPDTPASHDISDSASIVSTAVSASRSSSPPPSRIGSAPVRSTTKSQQRKARKDATKEQSAALSETRVVEPEEHAPILGRQKKKKREKPTPAPVTKPVEKAAPKKAESKVDATSPAPAEAKTKSTPSPSKKSTQKEQKKPEPPKAQPKAAQVVAPKTAPATTPSPTAAAVTSPDATEPQEPADNPKTMPDVVFSDLVRSGMTANHDYLAIFKTFNEQQQQGGGGGHNRVGHIFTTSSEPFNPPPSTKNIVSEQDHATLLSGMPVHKIVDSHRVLITPNGDCLRNLSEEEEQKYLFYQKRVARAADQPDSFVAPRHQPRAGGFSLVKGRAVPNGPPSFFPPNPAASQRLFSDDPVNKLQREEAISYINQFVLPRLNLGTANLGFPGGFKSAPGAANPGAAGKDAPGAPTHRDVAAASLNSLAPWIYGHDAAAGAGIYSAESGGAGMKDIPEDETPFGGLEAPGHAHDGTAQHQSQHAHHHPASKMPPLNGISLMSVEDAETALQLARKETEKLEKGLNQVIKRNRRLLLPGGGR